jgi:MYXO-CTERM domain-containing protein
VQLTGLPGFRAFEVNKNIKFLAPTGGSATATFVRQEFRQAMLPAPGAIALLGVAGFASRRRRA